MKTENEGGFFKRTSIRYIIFVYFTVTALTASIFIGLSLYSRMSKQMTDTMQEENQILIDQLNRSVDVWLRGIMKLSDTTYYGIVKNTDLRNESVNKEMTLLYDNNKDNVENIALFSRDGELLEAVPATRLKTGVDPAAEPWFEAALKKTENLHFSVPHVQRVFDAGETRYRWVISAALGGASLNALKTRILIVFIVAFVVLILAVINAYTSPGITTPIQKLERSVNGIEAGNLETEVYVGGSYEIRHLGTSIRNMTTQIRHLMDDIVAEHESKRKNEFDVLQSQINPHFLYNTLDIIVWMIENEKQADAVKVVTALARFFRISLSRGKSIIPVRDELEHVRNYLMIQHMRFKNRFTYEIEADEDVMELASVKLILQPLVENAVYHGMEFMDGDGEIRIRVYRDGEDLYMKVSDNGLGMTKEQVKGMFTDKPHVESGSGSGIGVRNVNERIRLYFGQEYGLSIESELDEGTVVTIHMRAVPYAETAEREKIHVK